MWFVDNHGHAWYIFSLEHKVPDSVSIMPSDQALHILYLSHCLPFALFISNHPVVMKFPSAFPVITIAKHLVQYMQACASNLFIQFTGFIHSFKECLIRYFSPPRYSMHSPQKPHFQCHYIFLWLSTCLLTMFHMHPIVQVLCSSLTLSSDC